MRCNFTSDPRNFSHALILGLSHDRYVHIIDRLFRERGDTLGAFYVAVERGREAGHHVANEFAFDVIRR